MDKQQNLNEQNLDQPGLAPGVNGKEQAPPKARPRREADPDGEGQAAGGVTKIPNLAIIGSYWANHVASYALTDVQKYKQLRVAYLKLKQNSKFLREDTGLISSYAKKRVPIRNLYTSTDITSSIYEKYECYPYKGFPYKRAVKLNFQDPEPTVKASNDIDMYGICVDIDESKKVAIVVPFGFSFKGYLMCNNNTRINIGDALDFTNAGEVGKSVAPNLPTGINMYALSGSFKMDFRTAIERKDAGFSKEADFVIAMVKVIIYGNRIENKKA